MTITSIKLGLERDGEQLSWLRAVRAVTRGLRDGLGQGFGALARVYSHRVPDTMPRRSPWDAAVNDLNAVERDLLHRLERQGSGSVEITLRTKDGQSKTYRIDHREPRT